MMKVLFLVNPHAGGKANQHKVEIANAHFEDAGWDVTTKRTESGEHAELLVISAIDEGYDLLVVAGGDGTLHHLVQHLPVGSLEEPSTLPFAIFPLGSGNDFYRGLGSSREPNEAAQNIVEGTAVPIDVGIVEPIHEDGSLRDENPVLFLNTAGVGMDSQTLATREKSPSWLSARYELVFLMTLARLTHVSANLKADDWDLNLDAYWILACNSPYIGSGMHVAPGALINDGLMDVLLIPKMSKLQFIMNLAKVFKGKHLEMKGVEIRKTNSMILKCKPEQRMALDGDLEFSSPAKISIIPKGLILWTSWLNGKKVQ